MDNLEQLNHDST